MLNLSANLQTKFSTMKKVLQTFLILVLLSFISSSIYAQNNCNDYYLKSDKLLHHLQALNSQWHKAENTKEFDKISLSQSTEFDKHEQLIKLHLSMVENALRKRSVAHLSELQKAKRTAALDVLNAYWNDGVFPINTYHNVQTPYFIDDFNTACAVGHIMRETDAQQLAATIAKTCNYAYIADMPFQEEMANWAYNSGFSVDELKWIQPSYGPQLIFVPSVNEPSCGAADGTLDVTVTAGDWYWGATPVEELMYVWDDGTSGTTLHNIEAGVYCLTAFDVPMPPDGEIIGSDPVLIMEKCFTVNSLSAPQFTGKVINETCPEALDGNIELTISDTEYSINWYNDQWELIGTGSYIDGLEGFPPFGITFDGTYQKLYHAEVTSGIGCKAYETFAVITESDNPYIFISNSSVLEAACGTANGYAEVIHDPGVTITWSDGGTGAIRNDLAAGNYVVTATNTRGCTYEYNFEMTEECPAPECDLSWFVPTAANCGLDEYMTVDGELIYRTIQSPLIADLPYYYYDCEGNFLCYAGGFTDPNSIHPDDCSTNNAVDLSSISFIQTVVACPNCNTDWFSDIYACGIDRYETSTGEIIYVTTSDPMIADAPTIYYDCEGNFLCESGGFYPIPLPQTVCSVNNAVDFNDLFFVETVVECIGINPMLCNTNWFEQNDFSCTLNEYVTASGATIYETVPSPIIADVPNEYYDCEGNFLCSAGGYPMPEPQPTECGVNNAVDFATLTFVQTVVPCNVNTNGCSTNWFEPSDLQCTLTENVTEFGATIYISTPSSIISDGTTNYYNCYGELLCYTGGIAGMNTCVNVLDIESLQYVQTIVSCPEPCDDLSWAEALIDNDCVCRVDLYEDSEGSPIVLADSDCNFIDHPDTYYDCHGNWICSTNGELMPESYCDIDFLNDLTFIGNLYTCDPGNLSCNGIANYSIQLRALLEGPFDGSGMNTDILDNGLLPTNHPYNAAPWNYGGTESLGLVAPVVVDWVMVCLRDADANLLASQAALINSEGDILNSAGNNCIVFPEVSVFDQYYVSIHHRGHLSVMSSQPVGDEAFYDFTTSAGQAMGLEPMKNVNGSWVLFGGDYDNNGIVNNLDFNNWYNNGAAVNQYLEIDIDGNGIVNNLDYNVWEINRSKVGQLNLNNDMGN